MNTLYIDQTGRTPKIRFSDGKLLLWGTIVPVDPDGYYSQLQEWVMEYSVAPVKETIVDIGIEYVRGFGMSFIQKLLQELIMLNNDQHEIKINWYFSPDSIDVQAGKHLSRKLNYAFNFVEVEGIQ
jgi:hypothetical protein